MGPESDDDLAEVLESVDDLVWSSGPDRTVHYVGRAFESIYGIDRDSLRKDPTVWRRMIHPDDATKVERALAGLRPDAPVAIEFRIVRGDGTERCLQYRARAIADGEGRIVRYAGVTRDVTESRLLEERVRRTQRLDALGRVAGGLAHEFNNLLTVIAGHAELLARGASGPTAEHASAILDATLAARATVKGLLAFGRRQASRPEEIDLDETVRAALELARPALGANIDVVDRLASGGARVLVDRPQLEQALLNLFLNARDAMPAGGELSVRSEIEPGGERVSLSVGDTGHGMDEATQARLFEPFFTTKSPGKGTGLGLSVVYGIVQQSGGEIRVESAPGRGATFRIALPVASGSGGASIPPIRG